MSQPSAALAVVQHRREELDRKRFAVETMGDSIKESEDDGQRYKEVDVLVKYAQDSDQSLVDEKMAHENTALRKEVAEAKMDLAVHQRATAVAERDNDRAEIKRKYAAGQLEKAQKRRKAAWNVRSTRPRKTKFPDRQHYASSTGKPYKTKKAGAIGKPHYRANEVISKEQASALDSWYRSFAPEGRAVAEAQFIAAARNHMGNLTDLALRKKCATIEQEFKDKMEELTTELTAEVKLYKAYLTIDEKQTLAKDFKVKHGLKDYKMQKLYAEYGIKMIRSTFEEGTFPELPKAPAPKAPAGAGANVDEIDDE